MIKGNELDVANIDFESIVTNSNVPVLHCLEIQRFAHISGTISDCNGVWIKMQEFKWTKVDYTEIEY